MKVIIGTESTRTEEIVREASIQTPEQIMVKLQAGTATQGEYMMGVLLAALYALMNDTEQLELEIHPASLLRLEKVPKIHLAR